MTNSKRLWILLAVVLIPPPANGGARLDLRVSPTVTTEPAYVTVLVTVETSPDNRSLEVIAESPDYRRSSQIPLDGESAPRLSTFDFPNLPTGVYEVSGTLVGQNGPRARTARTLIVAPSVGGPGKR